MPELFSSPNNVLPENVRIVAYYQLGYSGATPLMKGESGLSYNPRKLAVACPLYLIDFLVCLLRVLAHRSPIHHSRMA